MDPIACLAFSPHPDDAELFCGGLLAKLSGLGYRTGIIDLTRGEMASRGSVSERAEEADAAAKVLGLSVRENIGLPDCGLAYADASRLTPIVTAIRRYRPEILLVPEGDGRHPDHDAVPRIARESIFFASLAKYPGVSESPYSVPTVLWYEMRRPIEASFVVDISSVQARKMDAIRCHRSQVNPDPAKPPTLVGSALNLPAIEARDRATGGRIGVAYGEAYRLNSALSISDPVGFFRSNPLHGALFFERLS